MSINSSPDWNPRTKRTAALLALLAALILIWLVRDILPLVIVSALIAFLLNPLVTFLTKYLFISHDGRGTRRGVAALITFAIAIVVITIATLVVIPILVDQLEDFGRSIPRMLQGLEEELDRILSEPITFNGEPIEIDGEPFIPLDRIEEATGTRDILNLDALDINSAAEAFVSSASSLTGPAFSFLGGAFNTMINVVFLLMMTFYLLKDGAYFADKAIGLFPEEYQSDAYHILKDLAGVWNAYIRGQLILSVVMGVAVYFAATILGLRNAPILGLLAGLLEFIPNIGPLIALIPAALLALVSESATIPILSGFGFMVIVIFVWTGLQNIEAIFLVPRIMGDSLDLHPFIVMVSILAGATIGGAIGVIFAAPFVASGRVLARYIYGKCMGVSPFLQRQEVPVAKPTLVARIIARVFALCLSFIRSVRQWRTHRTQSQKKSQQADAATQE